MAGVATQRVVLVTPALVAANNGNWHTAWRWAKFLRRRGRTVLVQREWDGLPCDALVALHARRSADSIERFARWRDSEPVAPDAAVAAPAVAGAQALRGRPGLAVVMTGTDLYRDIEHHAAARRSLALADRLVLLNLRGALALPHEHRGKAVVILQSAATLRPHPPRAGRFDLLLVGHLRPEKDPLTAARALAMLPHPGLRLRQVGDVHGADGTGAAVADALRQAARDDPRIELMGPRSHRATRALIRRGRLLLLPSLMEGGANVLIEAVTSGVPVLASRIDGSVGLLDEDYPGYFPVGDAAALAALIDRAVTDADWLDGLRAACLARAARFDPALERAAVRALVDNLVLPRTPTP